MSDKLRLRIKCLQQREEKVCDFPLNITVKQLYKVVKELNLIKNAGDIVILFGNYKFQPDDENELINHNVLDDTVLVVLPKPEPRHIQLTIYAEKPHLILISRTSTLKELYEMVRKKLNLLHDLEIILIYEGKEVEESQKRTVREMNFKDNARLDLVVVTPGGRC